MDSEKQREVLIVNNTSGGPLSSGIGIKMETSKDIHKFVKQNRTPGSEDAIADGCTCDARENRYGFGYKRDKLNRPLFMVKSTCPVHGIGGTQRRGI